MELIKFSASWCQPCKALSKVLSSIDLHEHNVTLTEVDIDTQMELTAKYRIRSVPVLVLLDENKQEIRRLQGSKTKEDVLKFLMN